MIANAKFFAKRAIAQTQYSQQVTLLSRLSRLSRLRPLVGWIVGVLEGALVVGGLSALGAGLYSIGIPKDSVIEYETQIKSGKYVVITHGSPDEVSKTEDTLSATKHHGIKKHSCCG
jgi:hypothetical protein